MPRLVGPVRLSEQEISSDLFFEGMSTSSVQPVAARGPEFLLRSSLFYQSFYISDICIIFFGRQGPLSCWSGPIPSFCPHCCYCSLPRTFPGERKASAEQAMLHVRLDVGVIRPLMLKGLCRRLVNKSLVCAVREAVHWQRVGRNGHTLAAFDLAVDALWPKLIARRDGCGASGIIGARNHRPHTTHTQNTHVPCPNDGFCLTEPLQLSVLASTFWAETNSLAGATHPEAAHLRHRC